MNVIVKLATVALFASSAALASPHFGIQVGTGLAGFNGDDAEEVDAGIGFAVGGTMVMPLGSGLAFNPQVMFAYRTASATASYEELDYESTLTDMAIEVPVLLRYSIVPNFYVQAGPQLGLLISSESETEWGDESETEDILDDRAKLEYGLAVGAGFQITENWAVDLKYNYGLNSFDEDGDAEMSPYQFMLGGSYLF